MIIIVIVTINFNIIITDKIIKDQHNKHIYIYISNKTK